MLDYNTALGSLFVGIDEKSACYSKRSIEVEIIVE